MKSSATVFRIPRRLASEVIQSAQAAQAAGVAAPKSFFAELPPVLQTFFKKYPPAPFAQYSDKPTLTNAADANPFLANKHPVTKSWHKPKYSMRRQADLWKAAYRFGIESLMPPLLHDRKFYEHRYETSVPVKGQLSFKLSKGERIAPKREAEVQEAIAAADAKILERKGKRFAEFIQKKDQTKFV